MPPAPPESLAGTLLTSINLFTTPVAGYGGTFFWAEPKEQICAVYMTQAPSPLRASYRRMMKALVAQAIVD